MSVFNAPLYYVRGNHDDNYAQNPPDGGENIHGKVVYFKGLTIIGFEGSMFYHHPSAIQYTERQMRSIWRRMAWRFRFGRKIDIVLTHAPPLASMTPKTSATGVFSPSPTSFTSTNHAISSTATPISTTD